MMNCKARPIWVLALIVMLTLQEGSLVCADNYTLGFSDRPFSCDGGDIICDGIVSVDSLSGEIILMNPSSNKTEPGSWGTALTAKPIALLDQKTKRWNSFSTFFQFMVTSLHGEQSGDGMVFVLVNDPQFHGMGGSGFGMYNGSTGKQVVKTLAVEFDISNKANPEDVDNNHVGLDLEDIVSTVERPAKEWGVKLFGNQVYVWIDYESMTQQLLIQISYIKIIPDIPFLNITVNFTDVFGTDSPGLHAGFSAANGASNGTGIYHIGEWKFEHFVAEPHPGGSPVSDRTSSSNNVAIFAGVTAGAIILIFIIGLLFFFGKCSSQSGRSGRPRPSDFNSIAHTTGLHYSYEELSAATGQFGEKSKLGQGGFGCVYGGVLPSPRGGIPQQVAIKRLIENSKQGPAEFESEVITVSEVRHKGIVKMLGWCSHEGTFLIVYELMRNGSLDKALFSAGKVLPWSRRMDILRGVAEALHYLHDSHDQKEQIIHRDIKCSNILLDADYNPKLGDFGLARVLDRRENPAPMTIAGTPGFVAPEVLVDETFTTKSDVFAFGVVALEVVTGQRAIRQGVALKDVVWERLEEGDLLSCVDPNLEHNFDGEKAELVLRLGLLCCLHDPKARPVMREVVEVLAGSKPLPPVPESQPYANMDHHMKTLMSDDTTVPMLGDYPVTTIRLSDIPEQHHCR